MEGFFLGSADEREIRLGEIYNGNIFGKDGEAQFGVSIHDFKVTLGGNEMPRFEAKGIITSASGTDMGGTSTSKTVTVAGTSGAFCGGNSFGYSNKANTCSICSPKLPESVYLFTPKADPEDENKKTPPFVMPRAYKPVHILFHEPATIVYWEDDTRTVVKCDERDTFDRRTGLLLCYMKKAFGNNSRMFNDVLRAIKEGSKPDPVEAIPAEDIVACLNAGAESIGEAKEETAESPMTVVEEEVKAEPADTFPDCAEGGKKVD